MLMVDPHVAPGRSRAHSASQKARTAAILRVVLEELAEVGYSALSVDAVASRVGIAKTTIYRRYPTKMALVQAAMTQLVDESFGEVPDTGSLRGDLIFAGLQLARFASSVAGQGLFRTSVLDRSVPELDEIGRSIDSDRRKSIESLALRAMKRNEIASVEEFNRALDMLAGTILFNSGVKREAVGELEVARMVDVLLHGVATPKASSRNF